MSSRIRIGAALWGWTMACTQPSSPASQPPLADSPEPAEEVEEPTPPDVEEPTPVPERARIVVLMVGDGMGPVHLDAASMFRHGETGRLFMQQAPIRGQVRTASLSGVTDSAASATAMATGALVENGRVAMDAQGASLETLLERAAAMGVPGGVVSTSSVVHATPASFSAHGLWRYQYADLAASQVRDVQPQVVLGGGWQYFGTSSSGELPVDGLVAELEGRGCAVVGQAQALETAPQRGCLVGLFAPEHLTYSLDRTADTTEPTLSVMARRALEHLSAEDAGLFLLVEGSRIDMASHVNDLPRAVHEVLAFDDAVQEVVRWAEGRDDVTIVVTADHECGGLQLTDQGAEGVMPTPAWLHMQHTNRDVPLFAWGTGVETLHEQVVDHRAVHAVLLGALTGESPLPVTPVTRVDGRLDDIRYRVAAQRWPTNFGEGYNQLDALYVDVTSEGLLVGLEGLLEWERNGVLVLVDLDVGASTGVTDFDGALSDTTTGLDSAISGLRLSLPEGEGFGVDVVLGNLGALDLERGLTRAEAGARGITERLGASDNFAWLPMTATVGQWVRIRGAGGVSTPGQGLELFVSWQSLYALEGEVPPGARLGVAAVLVNEEGAVSNQALPAFSRADEDRALPQLVVFDLDTNDDGIPDGAPPSTLP